MTAYGQPNEDSDVDVMVVMPKKRCRRDLDFRVRMKVPAGFPVDLLVEPDDKLEASTLHPPAPATLTLEISNSRFPAWRIFARVVSERAAWPLINGCASAVPSLQSEN